MDFEALQEHRLQALGEKRHRKLLVLVECFFDEDIALWEVSVEHKVEGVGLNRHLMSNRVLLVIEEVFQKLLFLDLVVTLPYETLSATSFLITQDRSSDDLLQDKLVSGVSRFVVNLTDAKAGQ